METGKQLSRAAHFLLAAALVAAFTACVSAADPDPLRDFEPPDSPANYTPPDLYFKFDLRHAANPADGPGGIIWRANSANFPALRWAAQKRILSKHRMIQISGGFCEAANAFVRNYVL